MKTFSALVLPVFQMQHSDWTASPTVCWDFGFPKYSQGNINFFLNQMEISGVCFSIKLKAITPVQTVPPALHCSLGCHFLNWLPGESRTFLTNHCCTRVTTAQNQTRRKPGPGFSKANARSIYHPLLVGKWPVRGIKYRCFTTAVTSPHVKQ